MPRPLVEISTWAGIHNSWKCWDAFPLLWFLVFFIEIWCVCNRCRQHTCLKIKKLRNQGSRMAQRLGWLSKIDKRPCKWMFFIDFLVFSFAFLWFSTIFNCFHQFLLFSNGFCWFSSIFIDFLRFSSELCGFHRFPLILLCILLILLDFPRFSNWFSLKIIDFYIFWSILRVPKWLPCWAKKSSLQEVLRNACLRNSQGLVWPKKIKKFEGLDETREFLVRRGGGVY